MSKIFFSVGGGGAAGPEFFSMLACFAMPDFNIVCYCNFRPDQLQDHASVIQRSGLTTVIEFSLHIGRKGLDDQQWGDLVFETGYPAENDPFISNGEFNPYNDDTVRGWPNDLAALKQGGKVRKIFFCVGAACALDYTTIQYMLDNNMKDLLVKNFAALRKNFPTVDGIDLDCEEFGSSPNDYYPNDYPIKDTNTVGQQTIAQFSEILFNLGFEVTFCPYDNRATWRDSMQALSNDSHVVSWWNLQSYAGLGNRDEIDGWLQTIGSVRLPNGKLIGKDAAEYLGPGLSAGDQPPFGEGGMCGTFANMNAQSLNGGYNDLAGGFLWNLGIILNDGQAGLNDYVDAVNDGLNNDCP